MLANWIGRGRLIYGPTPPPKKDARHKAGQWGGAHKHEITINLIYEATLHSLARFLIRKLAPPKVTSRVANHPLRLFWGRAKEKEESSNTPPGFSAPVGQPINSPFFWIGYT